MKLNSKDKSLLLLLTSVIVVIWFLSSLFFNIFYSAKYKNADLKKLISSEQENWFNLTRSLEIEDLEDRIIVVYFWSSSCTNCFESMAKIKDLQKEYGNKILILGVHSPIFPSEKDYTTVKKSILRHDITHPVLNDPNRRIWSNFKASSWPTFYVINPYGVIKKTFVGKDELENLENFIASQVKKYKFQISRNSLPILLEKHNNIGNVLTFPTKLAYANSLSIKGRQLPVIFVANTNQNSIIVSSLTGETLLKIGNGKEGFVDGSFDGASFNSPQGLLYADQKLYVADTANHAIRLINFKDGKVQTIIGTGARGGEIHETDGEAKTISLASPTDLEFFPDENNIVISNSGSNQILLYNLGEQNISVFAGSGEEGIADGKYPDNSLAQTQDMAVYNNKLYFVDALSSSLRVVSEDGDVKTLSSPLASISDKVKSVNFETNKLLDKKEFSGNYLQSPRAITVDDTGVYITDSLNNKLKKYDFTSNQIKDLVGGKRGDELGLKTNFDEPSGILAVVDRFYISDTNNNRLVMINRSNFESELFNIMPPLKLHKEGFLQYLPNLENQSSITLKSESEINIKINLEQGWKINEIGPSFLNLLVIKENNQADLLANFDWNVIKNLQLKLPKLEDNKEYVLQGKIYYCKDAKNSLCYIKSYDQKIIVKAGENASTIEIKLGK